MAFAATNVQKDTCGSRKMTTGDWTGSVGDATGSFTVEGGRVYLVDFNIGGAAGSPSQGEASTSWTTSGATTTITVGYHEAVTAGTFIIIHA